MLDLDKLKGSIEKHEGRRARLYKDTRGFITGGIGRNFDAKPLRDSEIDLMFQNDLEETIQTLDACVPWWRRLPEPAARGLADMTFDLQHKVLDFKLMLAALQMGDGEGAADQVLDSAFAKQTGARAVDIANLYRSAF